jgi:membrane-bound serine protease (ClpP class)
MDPLSYLILGLILIGVGFLMSAVELVFPSGLFLVMAAAGMVIGVVLTFFYDTTVGVIVLASVFVAAPAFGGVLLHYWPKTPFGRQFLGGEGGAAEATLGSEGVYKDLEKLRGRYGKTLSDLRPAGMVDFDGRRIDTVTEGMLVAAGTWVRCIDVKAGRVIVRPAEKPNITDIENADFG